LVAPLPKDAELIRAVCALLAKGPLKARELARLLTESGIHIDRRELNITLYRVKNATPGLSVNDGVWSYEPGPAAKDMLREASERETSKIGSSRSSTADTSTDTPKRSVAGRVERIGVRAAAASAAMQARTSEERSGAAARAAEGGPRPFATTTAPSPPPQPFKSSPEQQRIIDAAPTKWTLVEAGPGTGKTAVALARVAHLLDQGVPATAILMVSFTRTAVTELRHRIEALAKDVAAVASVRITTLDSEAWNLGISFRGGSVSEKLAKGFDGNIESAISLFEASDPALCEWMAQTRHVIIDEAQDLVARRAELVFQILDHLPDQCGVTVFVDPAQAIYGFTEGDGDEDDAQQRPPEPAFHEKLLKNFPGQFEVCSLTALYRSSNPTLRQLFERGRATVLGTAPAPQRLELLREMARTICGRAPTIDDCALFGPDELVLFRRRSEVLLASSFLAKHNVPHRIRMGHASLGAHAWFGCLFGSQPASVVGRDDFDRRWAAAGDATHLRALDREGTWRLLLRLAGTSTDTAVDVRALRRQLARSRPPAELSQTEVGIVGPIIGTVHASKGREANRVSLMLSNVREGGPPAEIDQEVRVTYVGSTRARDELLVGSGYVGYGFRKLSRGRVYRPVTNKQDKRPGRIQVELGRPEDVDEFASVSKLRWTAEQVSQGQAFLSRYAGEVVELDVVAAEAFTYVLKTLDGIPLGAFGQAVNKDLFTIAKEVDKRTPRKPPNAIPFVSLIGVRTFAVNDDNPRIAELHEPWATTGIFLVPVVRALTKISLPPRTRGAR